MCIFKTTLGLSKELLDRALGCFFSKWVVSFNTLLLRVRFLHQHLGHCRGACVKCSILGPTQTGWTSVCVLARFSGDSCTKDSLDAAPQAAACWEMLSPCIQPLITEGGGCRPGTLCVP